MDYGADENRFERNTPGNTNLANTTRGLVNISDHNFQWYYDDFDDDICYDLGLPFDNCAIPYQHLNHYLSDYGWGQPLHPMGGLTNEVGSPEFNCDVGALANAPGCLTGYAAADEIGLIDGSFTMDCSLNGGFSQTVCDYPDLNMQDCNNHWRNCSTWGKEISNANPGSFQCQYWGCMDHTAINYNPYANIDDGSCECDPSDTTQVEWGVYDCLHPEAENFNPLAECDCGGHYCHTGGQCEASTSLCVLYPYLCDTTCCQWDWGTVEECDDDCLWFYQDAYYSHFKNVAHQVITEYDFIANVLSPAATYPQVDLTVDISCVTPSAGRMYGNADDTCYGSTCPVPKNAYGCPLDKPICAWGAKEISADGVSAVRTGMICWGEDETPSMGESNMQLPNPPSNVDPQQWYLPVSEVMVPEDQDELCCNGFTSAGMWNAECDGGNLNDTCGPCGDNGDTRCGSCGSCGIN